MQITVLYFASLAEQAHKSQELLNYDNEITLLELYDELKEKYAFDLTADQLKVAINDEFVDWDSALNNGDHVAFIPPVAGG